MILFERFLFDRRLLKDIWHHSLNWKTPNIKYMVAVSWSTIKGDWWKEEGEENAEFYSWEWENKKDDCTTTGVYIGRLAFVFIKQIEVINK